MRSELGARSQEPIERCERRLGGLLHCRSMMNGRLTARPTLWGWKTLDRDKDKVPTSGRRKDPMQSMRHPQLDSSRSPRTAEQSNLQDFDFRLEKKCMLNRYDMLRNVPPYANTQTQGYHTPPMSLLLGSTCALC